jgi:hypothetical protein
MQIPEPHNTTQEVAGEPTALDLTFNPFEDSREETVAVSSPPTPDPAGPRSTTVVLVYQDAPHERLGRTCSEMLSSHLGWNGSARLSEWKFEMLDFAKLRPLAAEEAQAAQLLVLATDCLSTLPAGVKAWIESWAADSSSPDSALVVLLSDVAGGAPTRWPDYTFVQSKADQFGRKLIVFATGALPENGDRFSLANSRRVLATGLCVVEGLPELCSLRNSAFCGLTPSPVIPKQPEDAFLSAQQWSDLSLPRDST